MNATFFAEEIYGKPFKKFEQLYGTFWMLIARIHQDAWQPVNTRRGACRIKPSIAMTRWNTSRHCGWPCPSGTLQTALPNIAVFPTATCNLPNRL
jgi:hypothetical protein